MSLVARSCGTRAENHSREENFGLEEVPDDLRLQRLLHWPFASVNSENKSTSSPVATVATRAPPGAESAEGRGRDHKVEIHHGDDSDHFPKYRTLWTTRLRI